jgi:FAD synthase
MTVEFHAFLRKSIKFNSVSALETQIKHDIVRAQECLAKVTPRN